MSFTVALARQAVRDLAPYASARSLVQPGAGLVFLDANEWPEGEWSRYPEPQPRALAARLASAYGVPAASLFLGRGADDAIDALVRVYCEAGTGAIVVTPPTYGFYEVSARIQGARVLYAPLTGPDFALDPAAILSKAQDGATLAFVCSPNNPTGQAFSPGVLRELAAALAPNALLVVDEAYVELAETASLARDAAVTPGLVVLRTLSKAWGLAGVRLGAAIATPETIALLHKVRAPYPVSGPAAAAALAAVERMTPEALAFRAARLRLERERLARGLAASPLVARVFPSDANFLLVAARDHAGLLARCADAGFVVRDRAQEPGLAGCVRISVGTGEENERLVRVLGGGERASGAEVTL